MHNVTTDNWRKSISACICLIQLVNAGFKPLGSDTMFEVVEISDACFVHILLQYTPHTS